MNENTEYEPIEADEYPTQAMLMGSVMETTPKNVLWKKDTAMYTTTKGTNWELTPKAWKAIKKCAAKRFDGSVALFESCWNQYKAYLQGSIDDPENIGDVMNWIDQIAAEKVNNPKSRFYIHG